MHNGYLIRILPGITHAEFETVAIYHTGTGTVPVWSAHYPIYFLFLADIYH